MRHCYRVGVVIERVMTDNGSCYKSDDCAWPCRRLNIRHVRTRPCTPRTNGKAERFIRTALSEWAYAGTYADSRERAFELPVWLDHYNGHMPDGRLNARPPVSRPPWPQDNLLRVHI